MNDILEEILRVVAVVNDWSSGQSPEGLEGGFIFRFLGNKGSEQSKTAYVNFIEEQFWFVANMDFKNLFILAFFPPSYKKNTFIVEIKEHRESTKKKKIICDSAT